MFLLFRFNVRPMQLFVSCKLLIVEKRRSIGHEWCSYPSDLTELTVSVLERNKFLLKADDADSLGSVNSLLGFLHFRECIIL